MGSHLVLLNEETDRTFWNSPMETVIHKSVFKGLIHLQ